MSQRATEHLNQAAGYHQVGEAQSREHGFGKGAHVDNALGSVETLQRRQWTTAVAVLAVVVVFDDPRVGALGPLEQSQPALQTHDGTERILIRGRDIGQACARRGALTSADVQAPIVHGYRMQARPRAQQCAACPRVTRLLHPGDITRIEQHACHQVEARLGTTYDDDLFRRAIDPTCREIVGDGGSECFASAVLIVAEEIRRRSAVVSHQQP